MRTSEPARNRARIRPIYSAEQRTMLTRLPYLALSLLATLAPGCTERNPAFCDETTFCEDGDRPFCDLDGRYGGAPNTCIPEPDLPDASIAVFDAAAPQPDAGPPCSPADSFLRCDGDTKVSCSSSGTEHLELCDYGCVESEGRCNECAAGTTTCAADEFTRCDADGLLLEQTDCPLGCHGTEARCSKMVPSNSLGSYLDLAADAGDIVLSDGATINTTTGEVTNGDASSVPIPSFSIPAPTDGVPIRVFVVKSLTLGDTSLGTASGDDLRAAAAIVAADTIVIDGQVELRGWLSKPSAPGGVFSGPCVGSPGTEGDYSGVKQVSGAGGGGHSASGGRGGNIELASAGGEGGSAMPNPDLVPLRGGCAGAGDGGEPGGAIQLVAGNEIQISAGAVINANGFAGSRAESPPGFGGGGGSGGGILLEAPAIVLGPAVALVANGGAGGCTSEIGEDGHLDETPAAGAVCSSVGASNGGTGAARNSLPGTGVDMIATTDREQFAGSGGGAAGYIRINTRTGAPTIDSDVVISPKETNGVVVTQ